MEFPESTTEPLGELHRPQQKRARTGYAMWQQPPFEWFVMAPDGVFRIHEKTLIVKKDVGKHQPHDAKQEILCAYMWKWPYSSRQG
jgi:hypothetical protein